MTSLPFTLRAMNAADRITVDVGGRQFETTTTTLLTSGCTFFQGLDGAHSTGGGSLVNPNEADMVYCYNGAGQQHEQHVLFVDRDGDVFQDVLYFMQTRTIRAKTLPALQCLKNEAEYFGYDTLVEACTAAIDQLMAAAERGPCEYLEEEEEESHCAIM